MRNDIYAVIMAGGSFMFLTGPDVIKAVTGEDVSALALGGADVHMGRSGVAHLAAKDEAEAMAACRRILDHLPQNNLTKPTDRPASDPIDRRDETPLA